MLEDGIRAQILAISDVAAAIGERLYPVFAPLNMHNYPCTATMQTASYTPNYTATPGSTGVAQKRIVIEVYSATYATVRSVIESIRAVMSGFQGNLPDGSLVHLCRIVNSQDFFEPDQLLYRAAIHLLVTYQE